MMSCGIRYTNMHAIVVLYSNTLSVETPRYTGYRMQDRSTRGPFHFSPRLDIVNEIKRDIRTWGDGA